MYRLTTGGHFIHGFFFLFSCLCALCAFAVSFSSEMKVSSVAFACIFGIMGRDYAVLPRRILQRQMDVRILSLPNI
jgi:hypothetical protein